MVDGVGFLAELEGVWRGDCVNHEGQDFAGEAFSASNNLPGIARFVVSRVGDTIILTLGDLGNSAVFREVVTLRIDADGALYHGFAWGMPGEAVQERSSVRLGRVA